jgi:nucleoside-triphosphatase THEP1
MQLQVITGHAGTGKTTKLQAIQTELASQGIDAPIISGASCTTPFFLLQIANQVMAGAKHFLADDCTRAQIKAVHDLRARGINSGSPEYLVIHLVQQA